MVSSSGSSSSSSSSSSSELGLAQSKGRKIGLPRIFKKLENLRNPSAAAPKGHVCVYVGHQRERFVIPISYLNHPFFQIMLYQSEETFGFCEKGAIIIPCRVPLFESVLDYMKSNNQEVLSRPVESYKLLKCVTDMNLYK